MTYTKEDYRQLTACTMPEVWATIAAKPLVKYDLQVEAPPVPSLGGQRRPALSVHLDLPLYWSSPVLNDYVSSGLECITSRGPCQPTKHWSWLIKLREELRGL